ncbi:MAG TPA: NADH-quinone oxidoreductase subunit L [Rhodanobacteraceae bacterium]
MHEINFAAGVLPAVLMLAAAFVPRFCRYSSTRRWFWFNRLAVAALLVSLVSLGLELAVHWHGGAVPAWSAWWLLPNLFGCWVSLLVQFLGTIIGVYSSRHLRGERRQGMYIAALAVVLASVHFLLLANHWVTLIAAWMAIGFGMQRLLTFYPERGFAQLAAHKKRVADRLADLLLIVAAVLAWQAVGSGSLSVLMQHIAAGAHSVPLMASGVLLALAVILRTALLPVHGWLIQVMEAPTPVSALLHAGVVNLGGYVLVFFAPLLGISPAARWCLVVIGLISAVLGGTVMLTRVTVKVHLAWSTLGQMGFMLLECGLGLYELAALHLLGHSLYKAHSFLAASSAVRNTRLLRLGGHARNAAYSLFLAPVVACGVVWLGQHSIAELHWPWWWAGILALAWAPLLWLPKAAHAVRHGLAGLAMVIGFTIAAFAVEYLPLGAGFAPFAGAGPVAFAGMAFMYVGFVALQLWPRALTGVRHWIYAGFYLDEIYTVLVLRLWPQHEAGSPGSRFPSTHIPLATDE